MNVRGKDNTQKIPGVRNTTVCNVQYVRPCKNRVRCLSLFRAIYKNVELVKESRHVQKSKSAYAYKYEIQ